LAYARILKEPVRIQSLMLGKKLFNAQSFGGALHW